MKTLTPDAKLRLTAIAEVTAASAIALSVALLGAGGLTPRAVVAVLVLGTLAALATNLEVMVSSNAAVNGSVMILVASIVVFDHYSFFLGPAIVGLFCGVCDVGQFRNHEWGKIGLNGGSDVLSMMAATVAFTACMSVSGVPDFAAICIAVTLGASTYLLLNAALLSIWMSADRGVSYPRCFRSMMGYNVTSVPLALLGLGFGLVYLSLGPLVVPLLIVPILIARATYASYFELKAQQESTIETLIHALEAKDRYTAGHAQRVATFCAYVGEEFAFGQRRMERLRYAALMHDIGKLVVPNQILNKPGRLTEAEFERVKRHEIVSVELLHRIDFLAPVAGDTTTEAATAAVDGTNLIEPAIIHVADAFDAMTSTRSYRRALSQETAFEELRDGAGTQFNGACVDALIAAIERRGERYGAGHEVDEHEWAVAPPEAGTGSAGLGHLISDELVPEEQAAGS